MCDQANLFLERGERKGAAFRGWERCGPVLKTSARAQQFNGRSEATVERMIGCRNFEWKGFDFRGVMKLYYFPFHFHLMPRLAISGTLWQIFSMVYI